jgi:glycosyltransferase involved in cell wall biosynthesis
VFFDKVVSLIVLLLIGLIGAYFLLRGVIQIGSLAYAIFVIFICGLIVISLIYFAKNLKVFPENIKNFLEGFLLTVSELIKKNKTAIALNFLITLVKIVVQTFGQWLIFLGLGVEVGFFELATILSLTTLISLLPLTANGIGIKEGTYAYLCTLIGIPIETAISSTIISTFINYLLVLITFYRKPIETSNEKIDILFVSTATPRLFFSGIEELTLRLAKYFKSKGKKVEILATSPTPEKSFVHNIKIKEVWAFAPNNAYYFSPEIFFEVRKSNAKIIHCNGYNNLATLATILGKKQNQKLVLFANRTGSRLLHRKIMTCFFDIIMNILSYKVDKIVASSNTELEKLKKILWLSKESKFCLVRNGVDKKFISSVRAGKKSNYIISIGRLVEHKGFAQLIKGFAVVSEKFPNLKLVIVGDGPQKKELESIVKNLGLSGKVDFLGSIPFSERAELISLVKKSKVFVLLSSFEGDPLMVSQAIYCKVPVVLFEKGVLADYVKYNKCVGVKNREDPGEVANKIVWCLKNRKRALPKTNGIPAWDEVGKKFESIYFEILGGH